MSRWFFFLFFHRTVAIPVYAKPQVAYNEGGSGRFDLTVGPKQTMGKLVEDVVVTVPFPKQVLNVNLTPSVGSCSFDPVKKELVWDVSVLIASSSMADQGS
ncbi:PREDICTED: AP-3 complex subunit mu-1-like [Acropora digitifera]|uniref:AP-3 complex subunit mu-1-like n=1 Tax=Acropora digitifera TaxID=70779 RepID=UPI000779FD28|nr:PREDICTED: AP-3 complex subunit mu-1-like [Acropora digitifera]